LTGLVPGSFRSFWSEVSVNRSRDTQSDGWEGDRPDPPWPARG
jgi:hypothetical protein